MPRKVIGYKILEANMHQSLEDLVLIYARDGYELQGLPQTRERIVEMRKIVDFYQTMVKYEDVKS